VQSFCSATVPVTTTLKPDAAHSSFAPWLTHNAKFVKSFDVTLLHHMCSTTAEEKHWAPPSPAFSTARPAAAAAAAAEAAAAEDFDWEDMCVINLPQPPLDPAVVTAVPAAAAAAATAADGDAAATGVMQFLQQQSIANAAAIQ
jgi:hypothetical protein